jgi:hypothetical protein
MDVNQTQTRRRRPPYTCPRCAYACDDKSYMRKHLYKVKHTCPAIADDLALTDDVKEYILANRVYKAPPPVAKPKKTPDKINIELSTEDQTGYIYIVREREFINSLKYYSEENPKILQRGLGFVRQIVSFCFIFFNRLIFCWAIWSLAIFSFIIMSVTMSIRRLCPNNHWLHGVVCFFHLW